MSGKKPGLTPLETRKQLLVLESEVNRVLLVNELREFRGEVKKIASHITGMGSVVSASADVAGAFAAIAHAFGRKKEAGEKSSWISTIFSGVRSGFSLWRTFKSHKNKDGE